MLEYLIKYLLESLKTKECSLVGLFDMSGQPAAGSGGGNVCAAVLIKGCCINSFV